MSHKQSGGSAKDVITNDRHVSHDRIAQPSLGEAPGPFLPMRASGAVVGTLHMLSNAFADVLSAWNLDSRSNLLPSRQQE